VWLFFLVLPMFFKPPRLLHPEYDSIVVVIIISNLVFIPFFYFNSHFLIPVVLRKKGFGRYFLSWLVTGILILLVHFFVRWLLVNNAAPPPPVAPSLFFLIFLTAISISYRLMADNIEHEKRQKESENEKLKSELSFLRSQISPHFMFNVLNSLVSLSRKKSELVEPVIIKLSELMRYMLYESDDARVTLEKEIRYIQTYIELQKIRFGNEVLVEWESVKLPGGKRIEPMLLIPFVENAFKHGIGMIEKPVIHIGLETDDENLLFTVKNKVNPFFSEPKDKRSGIGLANVKRRLDLLYPNAHKLQITEKDDTFEVELTLLLRD
jgi:LytS/YehU family sensor histidine kinase